MFQQLTRSVAAVVLTTVVLAPPAAADRSPEPDPGIPLYAQPMDSLGGLTLNQYLVRRLAGCAVMC
jgi:hypothetical protein